VPYCLPTWKEPPKVFISGSKDEAIKQHASDSHEYRLQGYSDGSGHNDRIAASAVLDRGGTQASTPLGYRGDAQVYHAELLGIAMALEKEAQQNRSDSITIYSDSQASLQAIQKADPLAA
jgi:hypothetical protein